MNSGIYAIVNVDTGYVYVGSSTEMEIRAERHFHLLEQDQHSNSKLQYDFWHHPDRFMWQILENVPNKDRLAESEEIWIRRMKRKYNVFEHPVR